MKNNKMLLYLNIQASDVFEKEEEGFSGYRSETLKNEQEMTQTKLEYVKEIYWH